MEPTAIIQPLIVLAVWTTIIMVLMFVKRIPAMNKAGIDPQAAKHVKDVTLPSNVTQYADNYNHLFEQPTLFYAVVLAIALLGHGDQLNVQLAWAFVFMRILHSLVQITINIVMLRFAVFMLSWAALAALIIREAIRII